MPVANNLTIPEQLAYNVTWGPETGFLEETGFLKYRQRSTDCYICKNTKKDPIVNWENVN